MEHVKIKIKKCKVGLNKTNAYMCVRKEKYLQAKV